ncbi:MAG: fimbria/pilus periplasmic chaperone, partial [Gammaproteobacteria bacterium]
MYKFVSLFFSFFLLLLASSAHGSEEGIVIYPMSVSITPSQTVVPITVKNESHETIILEAEVVKWDRKDKKDIYTATKDFIVTPPI